MADALLSFLINEVGSVFEREISQEVRLVVGVRKEIEKLGSTFMNLKAVLNDAEQRQMDEPLVKNWLSKLKNAAYEMEDVLDEWATEILRSQLKLDEDDDGETKTKINQVPKLSSYFCSPFSCFNQVAMRRDIASRIKLIRETLENIKNERDQFNFNTSDQGSREGSYTHHWKETSSIIIDRHSILGRDLDREIVVNRLLGVETSTNQMEIEARDPRIISIIGMGGLGKTTLAQLVFDHEKVKSHFRLHMWVCVSDPFNRTKVAKAIFRAATGKETYPSTWDALFKDLCGSVKGKKFLLVLDDVCTSDPNNLKELTHLLDHGYQGSRILVTTRSEAVVSELNSYKHILQGLNSEHSNSLLFCKAFRGKEKEKSRLLEDIGTRISNKCDGLPLALSLLGSLLNKKFNENQWRYVLESKIWELTGLDRQKKLVYPIFLLSYDGLESQLKNCFQYCAIFPKAHKIRKRTLIKLWMAQGFLNSSNEKKDPELTGEDYFDELAERSFFQDFPVDGVSGVCWKMHDLVHDFAQFLGEDHIYESYNNEGISAFNKYRNLIHLSLVYDERDVLPNSFHDSIKEAKNVRTVQCRSVGSRRFSNHSFNVGIFFSDIVHHLRYLRVLRLKAMGITHVPEEIDKLIHLRYLDLSRNEDLNELPDSMCALINLQTLKLKECSNLFKLPKEMGRMKKLRNYSGSKFPSLMRDVRALTSLRCLKLDRCNNCEELPALGLLPSLEELVIDDLKNLKRIGVEIYGGDRCVTEVAFPKLITLEIGGTGNLEVWEFDNGDVHAGEMMPCVRSIKLTCCQNLIALPALGLLPSLEELVIKGLKNLKHIGVEIYGGGQYETEVAFPKLITLEISETDNLKVWEFGNGEVHVREMMPRVTSISLFRCKNLLALPALGLLPSLEELVIHDLKNLKRIGVEIYGGDQCATEVSFPKLITLEIGGTKNLEVWEFDNAEVHVREMMPRVTSISLFRCKNLIALPALGLLPSLEELVIHDLKNLKRIGVEIYGGDRCVTEVSFPKLITLEIGGTKNLEVWEFDNGDVHAGEMMPCVRSIKLTCCQNLVALPALGLLPSLEELVIEDLENLKRIGVEIYGGGQCETEVAFPKLITLEISKTDNLELWEFCNGEVHAGEMMPCVRSIKLTCCQNLIALPALGLLPSLEELVIHHLDNLKRIGVEIYGGGGRCVPEVAFKELIKLEICATENLEVWEFGNGEVQMMPRVTSIKLTCCQNLIALPALNKLPSLETLKIEFANRLTSIGCNSDGGISFPKLTTLDVGYMDNLEVIVPGLVLEGEKGDTNNEIAIMPCLVDLTLGECRKFPLPCYLQNLRSLCLYEYQGDDYCLVRLGEIVRYKELQRLRITADFDKSLNLIPEYVKELRQLEHLDISSSCWSGNYGAGDWSILSHIPDIILHGQNIDPLTYSPPQARSPQPAIIKWQEEFLKVEIELYLPPIFFKAQLYYLTGVPHEKLQITYKGALVQDYVNWYSLYLCIEKGVLNGITVDEIVKVPEKGPVFMEDLPEEQQAIAVGHTAGLYNLGNTCYMNSTLQCLHSVPELKTELIKYGVKTNDLDQSSHFLTIATRDLFGELDRNVKPICQKQFWMMLCRSYPRFGQQHNGALMQQDAEECWTQILYTLSQSLRASDGSENPEVVKKLFGIDLVNRFHCEESGEESSEADSKYMLKCRISHEVNHLNEGLKLGLKTEFKKVSPSLGRSSIYLKESRINDLPRYLTIQFARFFWKRESNQKEMNLQKVDYPLKLDVYDLCSDELRKKLEAPRTLLRDEEGRKGGSKIDGKKPEETDVKMLDAEGSSSEIGETSASSSHEGSTSKGEGHLTGVYELVSVLTHKGMRADSGHYVAWVKQESGMWIQFDDDEAILRSEEDITKLSGGGDWHTAYICMYKARVIRN